MKWLRHPPVETQELVRAAHSAVRDKTEANRGYGTAAEVVDVDAPAREGLAAEMVQYNLR